MPTYDYVCEDCKKHFSVVLTIKKHESARVRCPKCDSRRVRQLVSQFFAVTSRKS
jgi:putative FmdB family regulatory protein